MTTSIVQFVELWDGEGAWALMQSWLQGFETVQQDDPGHYDFISTGAKGWDGTC